MVAFAPTEGSSTPHNGGDAGGWGTGNSTGSGLGGNTNTQDNGGLLITQMAALDNVTNVRIELVINGVAQEPIIADTTTTTDVLPKITPEDTVSGTAYINLSDGTTRVAQLDATQTSSGKVLKFKVPYKYSCSNSNGTLASGTYYARDGIDLSAYTESGMAGWLCQQDHSLHKGSFVTGVRGDITLVAVPEMTFSQDNTFGGYIPAGSTTPQTGVSNNPYLINYYGTDTNRENQLFINIANYTCDASALTMTCDKTGLFTISQQSSGYSFVVKLNPSIAASDSRVNGNAKLTVTDPATGLTKDIYVAIKKDVPTITMKTGQEINTILKNDLGANTTPAVRSFSASTTPPPSGATTYELSATDSEGQCLAWLDGTSIKYYAKGYTDSNRKIPLHMMASSMFRNCSGLTSIDVSGFDTSNVIDMNNMFYGCSNLINITGLSGFNTGSVTRMDYMFYGCSNLNRIDVSSFNTGSVTDMTFMFGSCSSLTTIYASSAFDTTNVTSDTYMFGSCSSLVGGNGTTFNGGIENKTYARIDGGPTSATPGYFTPAP